MPGRRRRCGAGAHLVLEVNPRESQQPNDFHIWTAQGPRLKDIFAPKIMICFFLGGELNVPSVLVGGFSGAEMSEKHCLPSKD